MVPREPITLLTEPETVVKMKGISMIKRKCSRPR